MRTAVAMAVVLGACGPPKEPAAAGDGGKKEIHAGQEVVAAGSEEAEAPPAPVTSASAASAAAAPARLPGGPVLLQALLPVPDPAPPAGFPRATTNDKDCLKSVGLTGNLTRDFSSLVAACGSSVGMQEYTKLASGSLGPSHVHETFQVTLAGGYCYRFFAMADGSIEKLNVRVERANGDLHSMINGKQPVVIFRPGEAWCRLRDRDFRIVIDAPAGEGHYSFGIWARPNERGRKK